MIQNCNDKYINNNNEKTIMIIIISNKNDNNKNEMVKGILKTKFHNTIIMTGCGTVSL